MRSRPRSSPRDGRDLDTIGVQEPLVDSLVREPMPLAVGADDDHALASAEHEVDPVNNGEHRLLLSRP